LGHAVYTNWKVAIIRGRWKCGSGKCRSGKCGSRQQEYCDRRTIVLITSKTQKPPRVGLHA